MVYFKKFLLVIVVLAAILISSALLIIAWFYATCPIYHFDEPKPFSGKNIYNPYHTMQPNQWKKAVFHLHTKSWGGITDGRNNSKAKVDSVYQSLQYDLVTVSNYMKFEKADNECTISAYEHGYNVRKTHQLCLNCTKSVLYRDYFFSQSLHKKQHIIDLLKQRCELVSINHPDLRNGYFPEEFKYLSGYDLFEVLNGARISDEEWDSALSNGHPAWLIANDDSHNVDIAEDVHLEVTFINAPTVCRNDIFQNLSNGNAFGVHFPDNGQTILQKQQEATMVSFPNRIDVQNDTLLIEWQKPMNEIRFIGDGGKVLKTIYDTDSAFYAIQPEDSYVRVQLYSSEGFVYYLNPVVRCEEAMPQKQYLATVDVVKTTAKRITISLFVIGIVALFIIHKKKQKKSI
ncbi:MAG: hypothetical protein PHR53_09910 [Bacteroidales bacterium]|nr:hypothetical protein [Bacteroidales bacterium]